MICLHYIFTIQANVCTLAFLGGCQHGKTSFHLKGSNTPESSFRDTASTCQALLCCVEELSSLFSKTRKSGLRIPELGSERSLGIQYAFLTIPVFKDWVPHACPSALHGVPKRRTSIVHQLKKLHFQTSAWVEGKSLGYMESGQGFRDKAAFIFLRGGG